MEHILHSCKKAHKHFRFSSISKIHGRKHCVITKIYTQYCNGKLHIYSHDDNCCSKFWILLMIRWVIMCVDRPNFEQVCEKGFVKWREPISLLCNLKSRVMINRAANRSRHKPLCWLSSRNSQSIAKSKAVECHQLDHVSSSMTISSCSSVTDPSRGNSEWLYGPDRHVQWTIIREQPLKFMLLVYHDLTQLTLHKVSLSIVLQIILAEKLYCCHLLQTWTTSSTNCMSELVRCTSFFRCQRFLVF